VGQDSIEQDQSFRAQMVADTVEAVFVLVGKSSGERFLVAAEDVHHEFRYPENRIVHVGLAIHADRDQWRVKRN
jgi:hypothetical protein